ncbi:LacI family DNA-binding transcriptional regulator [Humibacter albus]|uniref:LacI family DNA-binding transcriptional regulator n=1 Tax=Humibacter albus TaxID=427754 RepID=UPI0003B5842C|nr:LacI family DNA-binding transcriptional regulator [Humibacter albus]
MVRKAAHEKSRPASIGDVAARAGVSAQTVSRVSNGFATVKPTTRERVLAAMAELDYRPNSAARALKSGRFQTIGVLMFTLQNIGSVRILDAITTAAGAEGFSIDLIFTGDPSTGSITNALSRLDNEAVDGIIVILEAHELSEHSITFPERIPSVLIDSRRYDDRISVNADQKQGARLAVEHLLGLGHPTVWHVSGPVETSNAAADRAESWRQTLLDHGCEVPEPLGDSWESESGYEAGRAIAAREDVSAVFCANDQIALGVLRALHEAERAVPGEISVVGFDDNPESAEYWPPLTTVQQNFAEVGQRAFALLHEAIQGGGAVAPGLRLIDNTLVVRESTAKYAAPGR